MLTLPVVFALAQSIPCPAAAAALDDAYARVARFDMAGAADTLSRVAGECPAAEVAAVYLGGLLAAREAQRHGGSAEALAPVVLAGERLDAHAGDGLVSASIAAAVLRAAAAAAQSEREEMAVYLEHALALEALHLTAGTTAPVVTAHEAAGDLWLLVHQATEARAAYLRAVERLGRTPPLTLGLARAAARVRDIAAACAEYGALLQRWGDRSPLPPPLVEAREYLHQTACPLPN